MGTKADRNAPCYCGSGKKYKQCCEKKDMEAQSKKQKKAGLLIGVVFVIAGAGGGLYLAFGPGKYDAIAKCVTQKGYKMYGAFWCAHCQDQKHLFGKSMKYVNYIECDPTGEHKKMSPACEQEKIQQFPTWIGTDGQKHEAVFKPEELADLAGCKL